MPPSTHESWKPCKEHNVATWFQNFLTRSSKKLDIFFINFFFIYTKSSYSGYTASTWSRRWFRHDRINLGTALANYVLENDCQIKWWKWCPELSRRWTTIWVAGISFAISRSSSKLFWCGTNQNGPALLNYFLFRCCFVLTLLTFPGSNSSPSVYEKFLVLIVFLALRFHLPL